MCGLQTIVFLVFTCNESERKTHTHKHKRRTQHLEHVEERERDRRKWKKSGEKTKQMHVIQMTRTIVRCTRVILLFFVNFFVFFPSSLLSVSFVDVFSLIHSIRSVSSCLFALSLSKNVYTRRIRTKREKRRNDIRRKWYYVRRTIN